MLEKELTLRGEPQLDPVDWPKGLEEQFGVSLAHHEKKARICGCAQCQKGLRKIQVNINHWGSCRGTGEDDVNSLPSWMPDPKWAIPNEFDQE